MHSEAYEGSQAEVGASSRPTHMSIVQSELAQVEVRPSMQSGLESGGQETVGQACSLSLTRAVEGELGPAD